jgi:hypothetical protein
MNKEKNQLCTPDPSILETVARRLKLVKNEVVEIACATEVVDNSLKSICKTLQRL